MNINELKNDANFFLESIGDVMLYMRQHACSTNQYVARLSMFGDEPVIRIWAFKRRTKDNILLYTEVERKSLHCETAARKNIYFVNGCGAGYRPVYEKKRIESKSTYYGYYATMFSEEEFDVWYEEKPMGLTFCHAMNFDKIFECDKWKYCGWNSRYNLFDYLLKYEKEPLVEYFGKNGIPICSTLIRKAKKDRQFARYLVDNAADVRYNGAQAAIYAYDNHVTMDEAWHFLEHKRQAYKGTRYLADINKYKDIRIKVYDYMMEGNSLNHGCWKSLYSRSASYSDYWNACIYLGLDMNDTKNYAPKDFQRMHDLRIDEMHSKKAKEDAELKKNLKKKFREAAELYKEFEYSGEKYKIIVPSVPEDLVKEGKELHHCVGKMGYDRKMAEKRCFIAFVRLITEPDKPLVTVEYLTKEKKVSQCYADHDSRPSEEIRQFVDKWSASVTRKMKKGESGNAERKKERCVSGRTA